MLSERRAEQPVDAGRQGGDGVVADGLPSAETVGAYEQILPGAADRILSMLERQAEQRMELERRLVESAARTELLGQVFGLVIVVLVFVVSARLITGDHEVPGTVLAVADLAVLVAVFLSRDGGNREGG